MQQSIQLQEDKMRYEYKKIKIQVELVKWIRMNQIRLKKET